MSLKTVLTSILLLLISSGSMLYAQVEAPEPEDIRSIAWNHSSTKIAIGYYDGTVDIFDAATSTVLIILPQITFDVQAIAWNPSDDTLAIGSALGEVSIWNSTTGQHIADVTGLSGSDITSLSWSPGGQYLLISDLQGFNVWDSQSVVYSQSIPTSFETIWSSDHSKFFIIQILGDIQLHDGTTFQQIDIISPPSLVNGVVISSVLSHQGDNLILGSTGGNILLFNLITAQFVYEVDYLIADGVNNSVRNIWFDAQDLTFTTIHGDGFLRVWDTATGDLIHATTLTSSNIGSAEISPDGSQLIYSIWQSNALRRCVFATLRYMFCDCDYIQ